MNSRVIIIGLAIISSYSHAEDFRPINNLQRLFTSPEQRVVIDKLKKMEKIPEKSDSNSHTLKNTIKTTEKGNRISARGYITKNNGVMLTWIKQNGQLKLNSIQKKSPVTSPSNPIIHLKIDGQPRHVEIKPGQTYFRDEHIVYDDWTLGFKQATKKSKSHKKSGHPKKSATKRKLRVKK
ncbi:hypothetical protein MNBD_GAMMA12-450 [hydrothermal vent metagenome]|uniref:Uncharacterized protein n=1 Tax=hydrothermal vent metagenome TaxID=652676 RepID=A0A3B0YUW6_9ZZZZ